MARLNTFVHVHRDDGLPMVFGPDDVLPDWAVKAITNPTVWASEPEAEPVKDAATEVAPVDSEDDADTDTDEDGPEKDSEPDGEPVKVKRRPGRPRASK